MSANDNWNRNDWPMPLFGRLFDLVQGVGFATRYDDHELSLTLREVRGSASEAMQLPQDGLAGHVAFQGDLTKYFREGQAAYDPNDRERVHFWYRGVPTIEFPDVESRIAEFCCGCRPWLSVSLARKAAWITVRAGNI